MHKVKFHYFLLCYLKVCISCFTFIFKCMHLGTQQIRTSFIFKKKFHCFDLIDFLIQWQKVSNTIRYERSVRTQFLKFRFSFLISKKSLQRNIHCKNDISLYSSDHKYCSLPTPFTIQRPYSSKLITKITLLDITKGCLI